uniref:Uncharacterized protein n=1 Tax=Rhodosorus marinus TaxID=101924 RepID=A0A7S2ZJL7_9RHOD|mmetsp:Transcript_21772/g.88679  ORF Transcript_21772/g.88679 Transcript_21772/m.88679 type:complete len:392 (+) Transcript_21772:384-1559(+)|eukprot:CAMPEP_0113962814 /NCGR_PEP_ID=MMETSP0011_2-20120614/6151_1 /TAXON_ID=101924 /ORGANISM="Rhodosorus marinus" /LENGTH=391 /DNA_ID=CAMNT_0000974763 /DNA_START=122 /DNA_END=1297 /DNA_ORIENTATION=+ /assembly_acc=CAM_ASM_000156
MVYRISGMCSGKWLPLVLVLWSCWAVGSDGVEDLGNQSVEELNRLGADLDEKTAQIELDLVELEKEYAEMAQNETKIETDLDRATKLKDQEKNERVGMEEQLKKAKREVQDKKDTISKLSARISEIQRQEKSLHEKMASLLDITKTAVRNISDPSFALVLENNANEWGDLPRSMFARTQRVMGSGVLSLPFHTKLHAKLSPTMNVLLTAFMLYGGILGFLFVTYRLYAQLQGRLTIARILFIADLLIGAFWLSCALLRIVSRRDPLYIFNERYENAFFIFQAMALVFYICYVLIRVLILAARLTIAALLELLSVIIIGNHYYVFVWLPLMVGMPLTATSWTYFAYSLGYLLMGSARLYAAPTLYEYVANSRLGYALKLRKLEKQRLVAEHA